jgi:glycosyltransferase involved in cell wall biosynthesis
VRALEPGDKILVLTPVKDAEEYLDGYFESLRGLTYPHRLVSVAFLESDSVDGTYGGLTRRLPGLEGGFRSASAWKMDFGFRVPEGTPRWAGYLQRERRSALAKSRNHLLLRALGDEDWVLWLDVDVVDYPSDILERLLETGKDIVQPNCVREYGGESFDLNAWRDGGRLHLHDLRGEGDLVRLDSVGGTMLLVRADVHREGLVFPPYPYRSPLARRRLFPHLRQAFGALLGGGDGKASKVGASLRNMKWGDLLRLAEVWGCGEIETEGLALMAHDMGYECWGMPNLEVRHAPA